MAEKETSFLGEMREDIKLKDTLEKIRLSEYNNIEKSSLEKYLKITEDLPESFWSKIEDLRTEEKDLMTILLRMREMLLELYEEDRNDASSFYESRFTSLEKMIESKFVSCGCFVKIFGTALRKFGIPVKFIHGVIKDNDFKGSEDRHSWLKILNPQTQEWISVDFTDNFLTLSSVEYEEKKEYFDWGEELKEDYNNNNF